MPGAAGVSLLKKAHTSSRIYIRTVNTILATAAVLLLGATAAFAQRASAPAPSAGAPGQPPAQPKQGIRFIVRNMGGTPLNELFVLTGEKEKTVKSLRLGSRLPSERVAWDGSRNVVLYKEEPSLPETGQIKQEQLPVPYMTVSVPGSMSNKVLGLIVVGKNGKNRVFFLDEHNFRTGGIHAINFTSRPIKITLAKKSDFSDKVDFILAPVHPSEGISSKNSWNFIPKAAGETYNFVISTTNDSGQEQRIRSSRFNTAKGISQINLFMREEGGRVTMSSINLD